MEGRGLREENMSVPVTSHTQGCVSQPLEREAVISGLGRVRQAAMKDKNTRFTALMHHMTLDLLRDSFMDLNHKAAPGIDSQTWDDFEADLDANILELYADIRAGGYRALPSMRRYIPKADGRLRPLGIASVEDKIVQRAAVEILSAIYEVDFVDSSYGFRPNRGCHDALDQLYIDITQRKVSWILDADIQGFFDAISHDWMIRFLEHRIADTRMIQLVRKWLKAGYLEKGEWRSTELGCPQGGSASPLLANIYLHYVLDLWVEVQKKEARGEVHFVRYADDFVVGFQYKDDAVRFLNLLGKRLGKFELSLHPTKTRLIEFGRFAAENRRRRGEGKPETFDFLGFTHICSVTRKNKKFKLLRKTINKRMTAKLKALGGELRLRINEAVKDVGKWLGRVVTGYYNYYAVHDNLDTLGSFRYQLGKRWMKIIRRRSHKARMTWDKFGKILKKWIPAPTLVHPYPNQR